MFIVMNYCEGGDLYTRLKDQKSSLLDENQIVQWFVQIAMALQYMHEKHILHRDLKTQNIFLTRSKIIKVCIIDKHDGPIYQFGGLGSRSSFSYKDYR